MTLPCGKGLDWPALFALSFMIVSRKCVLAVFSVHMLARLSQYLARLNWKQKNKTRYSKLSTHPRGGQAHRGSHASTHGPGCVWTPKQWCSAWIKDNKKNVANLVFFLSDLADSSPPLPLLIGFLIQLQLFKSKPRYNNSMSAYGWFTYRQKRNWKRTKEKKKRPRKEKGQRKCVFLWKRERKNEYILLHISFALLYIGNHCVF